LNKELFKRVYALALLNDWELIRARKNQVVEIVFNKIGSW
jgi:hypothetical protein